METYGTVWKNDDDDDDGDDDDDDDDDDFYYLSNHFLEYILMPTRSVQKSYV